MASTDPLPFAGAAAPLDPSDLEAATSTLGVDVATIRAVLTVETGGAGGFLTDGSKRPRILFEAHIFGRLTGGKFNTSHPDISRASWTTGLYLGGAAEYGRLARAVDLDRRAALSAASWGLFQILGTNFQAAGFTSVENYVAAMMKGEREHLLAFCAFVKANRLTTALRARDWAAFARSYNGPSYAVNRYDEKLAAAYERFAIGEVAVQTVPSIEAATTVFEMLKVGDRGEMVRAVQQKLHAGEAQLSIDGVFGRATESAVIRFQAAHGLRTDGVVGPSTWRVLNEEAS